MDTRTRWTIGILVALVIGLGVGLIIVAADDSGDTDAFTVRTAPTEPTETGTGSVPTTTSEDTGGTPAPTITDEGTTTPDGQGGL
jgi:hypothetical protein